MNLLTVTLLTVALIAIQTLIGGAKLVYGLPVYLLIGLTGIVAIFARQTAERARLYRPCVSVTALFAAYILIRACLSPVDYLSRTDFFMTLATLAVYLTVALRVTETRMRVLMLWGLLIFALLHVAGGAIQFRQGDNSMLLPWILRPDYGRRASGFYICPNHLAGLLEMLGLLGLSLMIWGCMKIWVRVVLGYVVVVCFLGVAITGSRGGYLSTTAGLIVLAGISLLVLRTLRPRLFYPALGVSLLSIVFAIGAAIFLMSKSLALQQRLDAVYDPGNMRLLLWEASLKQLSLNPIFGTGSGTYYYYGRQFRSELVQNDPVHVHNDYLELLCEYGWVGVVLAAAFLLVHFIHGWRGLWTIVELKVKPSWSLFSNELALNVGVFSALAALLVHSIIDFNLHIPANTVFVGALFGFLAQPDSNDAEETVRIMDPGWWRFAPAGVGVILIALAAPLIPGEYLGERARMALRDRHYAESQAFAAHALSWEKKNPDLFYYLGEATHYVGMEQPESADRAQHHLAAADAFQSGLTIFPHDLRLMLKLGRTLDLLGRFTEAELLFHRAIKADPNFGNVYAHYGVHVHLQRRFDAAEQLYKKAMSLGENEIAPVGLRDLHADRQLQSIDPFAEFVTEEEEIPLAIPELVLAPRP